MPEPLALCYCSAHLAKVPVGGELPPCILSDFPLSFVHVTFSGEVAV